MLLGFGCIAREVMVALGQQERKCRVGLFDLAEGAARIVQDIAHTLSRTLL